MKRQVAIVFNCVSAVLLVATLSLVVQADSSSAAEFACDICSGIPGGAGVCLENSVSIGAASCETESNYQCNENGCTGHPTCTESGACPE